MFNFSINKTLKPVSQSNILVEIDDLVRHIQRVSNIHHLNLSKQENHQGLFDDEFYSEVLTAIPKYLSVYSPQHTYNEYVDSFWQGCIRVGLLTDSPLYTPHHYFDDIGIERIIALVEWLTKTRAQFTFRLKIRNRMQETKQNNENLMTIAHSLRELCSKLLVIRVDFGYGEDRQHFIKIDDVFRHIEFFANKMNSNVFSHELGRAFVIEQAREKGYHVHAVFFFNGHKVQNDWFKAKQIGDLWVSVAEGMGTYFNLHTKEAKREYIEEGLLGIGMILRKDDQTFKNLLVTLNYFAKPKKDYQYLRMKPAGANHFYARIGERKRKPRTSKQKNKGEPKPSSIH